MRAVHPLYRGQQPQPLDRAADRVALRRQTGRPAVRLFSSHVIHGVVPSHQHQRHQMYALSSAGLQLAGDLLIGRPSLPINTSSLPASWNDVCNAGYTALAK